jgi:hypothetical protein
MYCPSCGADISEGSLICPSCKRRLPYSTFIKPIDPESIKAPSPEVENEEEVKIDEDTGIGDSWYIFTNSCYFLIKKPIFIVPIFFACIVYITAIIYFRYYFNFPHSFFLSLFYIYLLILFLSVTICCANLMMLEFVQKIESGQKISFRKALKETFGIDFIKMFPLALFWAILWFIIVILRALTSRKKYDKKTKPSAKEIAATLADVDSPFSFFGIGLSMIEKLIRMVVFLALPSIAWENQGPISAVRRAFSVIKEHTTQFLVAYSLTLAVSMMLFIPLAIVFTLSKEGVEFSSTFWTAVIIYEGIIWSLSIYLEQMSTAILYLWHIKWTKYGAKGNLNSVSKPDLFDDIYELK